MKDEREVDNKNDHLDPGDLVYDEGLRKWIDTTVEGKDGFWKDIANEMNYGKELDVHHDTHKPLID